MNFRYRLRKTRQHATRAKSLNGNLCFYLSLPVTLVYSSKESQQIASYMYVPTLHYW